MRELCIEPNPVLRKPARPVSAFAAELRRLAHELIETMYAHDGIGLAAPQVGLDLQLVVANPSQQRGRELVVANPVIETCQGRAAVTEGCLSVPNLWERVSRARRIHLSGQDLSGRPLRMDAEGLLAIVLQHEIDHLQGRLLIDRLPWWRRWRVGLKARNSPHACA